MQNPQSQTAPRRRRHISWSFPLVPALFQVGALLPALSLLMTAPLPQGILQVTAFAPSLQCDSLFANFESVTAKHTSTSLNMGLFDSLKDSFSSAFDNDTTLSRDGVSGAIEDGTESEIRSENDMTDVQKRFWASQQQSSRSADGSADSSKAGDPSTMISESGSNMKGAPVTVDRLISTQWDLSLYLCGIPTQDPSNNLYGGRTNISTRNKDPRNAGLPLGAKLPDMPSTVVRVELMEDGTARVVPRGDNDDKDENQFLTGTNMQWMLSQNGRTIRISMDCTGYTRTVTTKGTIQKIYWSDGENEVTTQTSSDYIIPPGPIFAENVIGYGKPGELVMLGIPVGSTSGGGSVGGDVGGLGLLTVERTMGLLGATRRMEVCGKFCGVMIDTAGGGETEGPGN